MLRKTIILTGLLLASILILATYSIDVNKVSDYPAGVKTLAVLPSACPPSVNAIWLDEQVAGHLRHCKQFTIIPSKVVKQAMFDMSIQQINDANREALAQKLGADGFLVVLVGHSSSESEGVGVGVWSGNMMTMSGFAIAKGGVEIAIVSAKDGRVLLKGTGFGETDWKTEKGVLAKVVQRLFEKAMK